LAGVGGAVMTPAIDKQTVVAHLVSENVDLTSEDEIFFAVYDFVILRRPEWEYEYCDAWATRVALNLAMEFAD